MIIHTIDIILSDMQTGVSSKSSM